MLLAAPVLRFDSYAHGSTNSLLYILAERPSQQNLPKEPSSFPEDKL